MRKFFYFLLFAFSCAPIPDKSFFKSIEPTIDLQQARDIALKLMKEKYSDTRYLKDSISVHEMRNDLGNWEVWIKHTPPQAPPYFVILVDKITGVPKDISDKLE